MKKKLLFISLAYLAIGQASAQTDLDEAKEVSEQTVFNRWTLEASAGQAKGIRPFTQGYYSSNPNSVLGTIDLNSFTLGARYMFSPRFGLRLDGSYDMFQNNSDTESKPF